MLPRKTRVYADRAYWEDRFEAEVSHEWFAGYHRFRHCLRPFLSSKMKILIVGNGTSSMPMEMIDDGYQDITVTDICPNLINKLQQRYPRDELSFEVADVLTLPYETATFDAVVEKGTLDVFFADADSFWTPPPSVIDQVTGACSEIHRVLKHHGLFFSITFMQPMFRRPHLIRCQWTYHVDTFGEPGSFEYYIYRLQKTTSPCTNEQTSYPIPHERTVIADTVHDLDDASFLFNLHL